MPTLVDVFTDIANAIRSKEGSIETIPVSEMGSRILSIETKEETFDITITSTTSFMVNLRYFDRPNNKLTFTYTAPTGTRIITDRIIGDMFYMYVAQPISISGNSKDVEYWAISDTALLIAITGPNPLIEIVPNT